MLVCDSESRLGAEKRVFVEVIEVLEIIENSNIKQVGFGAV